MSELNEERVFAKGHEVLFLGRRARITAIRVAHDLSLGPLMEPHRFTPVCDLDMLDGARLTNIHFNEAITLCPLILCPPILTP